MLVSIFRKIFCTLLIIQLLVINGYFFLMKKNRKPTVLIAEDEPYNYILLEEFLIDLDLNLIYASDGAEAVKICQENPQIDLVLMDIKMPNLDGYEASKKIREFRPELPIIAQSAYAMQHEIVRYRDVFDDYVIKPIVEDLLKKLVIKYLKI